MSPEFEKRLAARENLDRIYRSFKACNPLDVADFDASSWEPPRRSPATATAGGSLAYRANKALSGHNDDFPTSFATLAKVFVCAYEMERPGQRSKSSLIAALEPFKYLFAKLGDRCCEPADLRRIDFERAKRLAGRKQANAYALGLRLGKISAFLDEKGLVSTPLRWMSDLKPGDGRRKTDKEPSNGYEDPVSKKMLDDAVVDALSQVSNRDDLDDQDLLCQRSVEIMLFSGKRINEVLTAPREFLISRSIGELPLLDGEAFAMRFWPLKDCPVRPTWVATEVLPVIRRAVADVVRITERSWLVARFQADNEGRTLLGGRWDSFADEDMITLREASEIVFGFYDPSILGRLHAEGVVVSPLPCPKAPIWNSEVNDFRGVRKKDLVALLLRHSFLGPVIPALNPSVRLADCLFVVPPGFSRRLALVGAAAPLKAYTIAAYLGGPASIFGRLKILDDKGRPFSMTSRQARHWISTKLERGGLSPIQLAHWLGRRDHAAHPVYSHVPLKDRARRLRRKLEVGEGAGPVPDAIRRMPFDDRAAMAASIVPVVRAAADVGQCTHDFSSLPCLRDGDCLGCRHHWTVKGDASDLAKLKAEVETLGWLTEKFSSAGKSLQLEIYERRLSAARAMLAHHHDAGVPDGTPINAAATSAGGAS